jgi:MyTH4 domain
MLHVVAHAVMCGCVSGYSGDRSMSFPATLAQDILQKGLETPEIVDEIYLQICKHLTANPRPESCQRGWQVMCMCVGTFPPSRDFEDYLLNFILQHTYVGHFFCGWLAG